MILIKPFDGGLVQPLAKRLPGVGYVPPSKPWRWRGKRLRRGGDVCGLVFSQQKAFRPGVFCSRQNVKLSSVNILVKHQNFYIIDVHPQHHQYLKKCNIFSLRVTDRPTPRAAEEMSPKSKAHGSSPMVCGDDAYALGFLGVLERDTP